VLSNHNETCADQIELVVERSKHRSGIAATNQVVQYKIHREAMKYPCTMPIDVSTSAATSLCLSFITSVTKGLTIVERSAVDGKI
jgi:hypothetical protein